MKEYYLHVDLIVPASNEKEFEETVSEFLRRDGFRRLNPEFDNELVLALKTPKPFVSSGYERFQSADSYQRDSRHEKKQQVFRYVNLWSVPDLNDLDLAQMMSRAADDELYTRLNSLVARELQNYVIRVQWLSGRPAVATNRVIRVTRQFTTENLGIYLFKIGALFPLLEENGWVTLGHYQNVTGPLNTVTEFWQTKDGVPDPASMNEVFLKLDPRLQAKLTSDFWTLPVAEVRESLVPAPYLKAQ